MCRIGLHPRVWVQDYSKKFFGKENCVQAFCELAKIYNFVFDLKKDEVGVGYDEDSVKNVDCSSVELLYDLANAGYLTVISEGSVKFQALPGRKIYKKDIIKIIKDKI